MRFTDNSYAQTLLRYTNRRELKYAFSAND